MSALREETKAKIRKILISLVNDCLNWYVDDLEEIEAMSEDKLKLVIADYIALQWAYQFRSEDMPKTYTAYLSAEGKRRLPMAKRVVGL